MSSIQRSKMPCLWPTTTVIWALALAVSWGLNSHMCTKDDFRTQKAILLHSAAPLTHRPRKMSEQFKSRTLSTERQKEGEGGFKRTSIGSDEKVLGAKSSAMTSLQWDLTVKNYLARQLWLWQMRAGGLHRQCGPPSTLPCPFPLLSSLTLLRY